ncbi:MAG TPA: hypothetical protein VFF81_00690 [Noviherbaspirillum sp.]|nr:hypothetical protein [Noviherbaspirillum sp.]
MELTRDILEDVFQLARQVRAGDITLTKGANDLVRSYGFNPNSATMTIRSPCHMLKGKRYRRALTVGATDYFFTRIKEEDGNDALLLALKALSSHIDYRHKRA